MKEGVCGRKRHNCPRLVRRASETGSLYIVSSEITSEYFTLGIKWCPSTDPNCLSYKSKQESI